MDRLLFPILLHRLDDRINHARIGELHFRSVRFSPPKGSVRLTVDVSPNESSSPAKILRRIRLIILPDRVLGRSSTMKTAFGAAKGPIDLRTWRTRSFLTWSLDSLPSLRATKAFTAWPVNSSLMPTTAASATWSSNT